MRITFDTSSTRERRSGLSRKSVALVLALMLVSLGLIVLDGAGAIAPIKGQAQALLEPVELRLTQARLRIRDGLEALLGSRDLRRRVAELEREAGALREENLRLQTSQCENAQLKVELGIRQTYQWITLSATVVQANAENGRRLIRINRGRIDGVRLGMPVVAKEGGSPAALVGVVDALYAQTADVLLITDYGSVVSANTTQLTPAKGLVIGQWQVGSRIKLVDVDPAATLAKDDYVVTSGLSKAVAADTPIAQIPANVPIGIVTNVERTNHTQTAEVQPFVDPDRVRSVWIITGQK